MNDSNNTLPEEQLQPGQPEGYAPTPQPSPFAESQQPVAEVEPVQVPQATKQRSFMPIVWVIVGVVIGAVAYAAVSTLIKGNTNNDQPKSATTNTSTVATTPSESTTAGAVNSVSDTPASVQIVRDTYETYITALRKNSRGLTGLEEARNIFSVHVTTELQKQLQTPGLAYDPYICAQDTPKSITVKDAGNSKVQVVGYWEDDSSYTITLTMNSENKISSITCPVPGQ